MSCITAESCRRFSQAEILIRAAMNAATIRSAGGPEPDLGLSAGGDWFDNACQNERQKP